MSERCVTLEENATALEKEKPNSAFELYKRAAKCYGQINDSKKGVKCLKKAVEVLKSMINDEEDIFKTLEQHNTVSEIFKQLGKQSDADKMMKDVYKRFITLSSTLREEVKQIDDPFAAEPRIALAAAYAKAARDKNIQNICWVDLGDKYRKKAVEIPNPRQALELYTQAAKRYFKGENDKLANEVLVEAAKNFTKRGQQIEKSRKDLILAIDNYTQATILNNLAKNEKQVKTLNDKIEELCNIIGLPRDHITDYLENELGLKKVS